MTWKRGIDLAAAAAFVAFLGWMLVVGQYGTLATGLGILAGSFAAYSLTRLELPAPKFWAVVLAVLGVSVASLLASLLGVYWEYVTSFLFAAGILCALVLLLNRYRRPRQASRSR